MYLLLTALILGQGSPTSDAKPKNVAFAEKRVRSAIRVMGFEPASKVKWVPLDYGHKVQGRYRFECGTTMGMYLDASAAVIDVCIGAEPVPPLKGTLMAVEERAKLICEELGVPGRFGQVIDDKEISDWHGFIVQDGIEYQEDLYLITDASGRCTQLSAPYPIHGQLPKIAVSREQSLNIALRLPENRNIDEIAGLPRLCLRARSSTDHSPLALYEMYFYFRGGSFRRVEIDAITGSVLNSMTGSFGGGGKSSGSSVSRAPFAWNIEVIIEGQKGHVQFVGLVKRPPNGREVIVLVGRQVYRSRFDPKTALLTVATNGRTSVGRPDPKLLAALRGQTESR